MMAIVNTMHTLLQYKIKHDWTHSANDSNFRLENRLLAVEYVSCKINKLISTLVENSDFYF